LVTVFDIFLGKKKPGFRYRKPRLCYVL